MDIAATNKHYFVCSYFKILYLYGCAQDLASTCLCLLLGNQFFFPSRKYTISLTFLLAVAIVCSCNHAFSFASGNCTVFLTFPLAAAIVCSCNHALQSRHVSRTAGDLSEPWKGLQCQQSHSPSSLSLSTFPSLHVFPACSFLSSLPSIPRRAQ